MFLRVWRRSRPANYFYKTVMSELLSTVYHSSVMLFSTVAEYGLFFLVEWVTVAKLVVSAPARSLQSEVSTGLPIPAII